MDDSAVDLVSLIQVRYFVETARGGSFTAAANAIGVTQPAVAEQMRLLERALGVPLFARAARGVTLTSAGHAFEGYAVAALDRLAEGVRAVEDTAVGRRGTLAFGLFANPIPYRIDELAATFARAYPGVTLRLVGQNSSDAAELVRRGELEAALVALPIDADRLDVRPLLRDEVVYVSADPANVRRAVAIEDLVDRSIVFFDVGVGDSDPIRRQLLERAQEAGVRLTARIEVETLALALRLVAAGLGDTYLPRAHTTMPSFPSSLSIASFRPSLFDTLALVTREGVSPSPLMRIFIEHVERHVSSLGEVA